MEPAASHAWHHKCSLVARKTAYVWVLVDLLSRIASRVLAASDCTCPWGRRPDETAGRVRLTLVRCAERVTAECLRTILGPDSDLEALLATDARGVVLKVLDSDGPPGYGARKSRVEYSIFTRRGTRSHRVAVSRSGSSRPVSTPVLVFSDLWQTSTQRTSSHAQVAYGRSTIGLPKVSRSAIAQRADRVCVCSTHVRARRAQ